MELTIFDIESVRLQCLVQLIFHSDKLLIRV